VHGLPDANERTSVLRRLYVMSVNTASWAAPLSVPQSGGCMAKYYFRGVELARETWETWHDMTVIYPLRAPWDVG